MQAQNSPYVITTRQRDPGSFMEPTRLCGVCGCVQAKRLGRWAETIAREPGAAPHRHQWTTAANVFRRAVHTLDKARHDVELELVAYKRRTGEMPSREFILAARSLSEAGGTIGPLPDGTVIEVAQETYRGLADAAGWQNGSLEGHESEIIDAYNARYAS